MVRSSDTVDLVRLFTDPSDASPAKAARSTANYGAIPLHFEPNVGQAAEHITFFSRAKNYDMFLTGSGSILHLRDRRRVTGKPVSKYIEMKIAGANDTRPRGEHELEGKTNYLVGNDPEHWKTGIPNYGKVRYPQIYDGIDAIFYGDQENIEYDFIVAPNAPADQIAVEFDGIEKADVNETGDLILSAGGTIFRQKKPIAYQVIAGQRRDIDVDYEVGRRGTSAIVGFNLGEYDLSAPLTIDPVLSFSTYLGGNTETIGNGIAIDQSGNAYVAGYTSSTAGFPLVAPFQSQNPGGNAAFVTKINSAGTAFVYSTYLTGPTIGNSAASSIAVDPNGNAYVAGISQSCSFPTTAGSYLPAVPNCGGNFKGFVVKLNPSGSGLAYGTYLSSPDFLFNGELNGIALDSANNAYITGWTGTASFPTTPGAFKRMLAPNTQNAFVSKLSASGSSLVYSTFIGINTPVPNSDPFDKANAITVDSAGNAYITGQSVSQNFPVTNTAFQTFPGSRQDAFVTKLNANGTALIYSTYLGGNGDEIGRAIAVDAGGNAYVTGNFDGSNGFPFTPNAFRNGAGENCCASVQNAFLTKINPTGTALIYSTSLGTERQAMGGTGVAVDNTGSAYVVGGQGINAAYIVNAIQPVSQNNDAFLLKMNPAGTGLTYSTNFGGANGRSIGNGLAIDPSGAAYITGLTNASNFPITAGAPQNTKPGGQSDSSFIAKISTLTGDCPAITIGPQPLPVVEFGHIYSQQLSGTGGVGPYGFSLAPGFGTNLPPGLSLAADGMISGMPTNTNFGSYIVTIQAVDSNNCVGIRTFNIKYIQRTSPIEVRIIGRTHILRGRPNRYVIELTNNSDEDLYDVPLYLRFPDFLMVQQANGPNRGQTVAGSMIPQIRSRATESMSIIATVPDLPKYADTSFTLEARVGSPFPASPSTSELLPMHYCGAARAIKDNSSQRPDDDCPPDYIGFITLFIVSANDPNNKVGPQGVGPEQYTPSLSPLPYVINFENLANATAPAHTIEITDQLDISKYDLSTFSFGDITLANQSFSPNPNRTTFTKDFDLRPANNIIARLNANLNSTTGLVTWRLESIDLATGLPTDDPLAGILPPNTTSPRGEGSVSFRVRLKPSVTSGTQISNQARIIFDTNAAIDTPVWTNTLDITSPTSSVQALPATVPPSFTVSWAGNDTGSGIGRYTIYVSDNGGPFLPFLQDTTQTTGVFNGQAGHTYGFYSIATDAAGNREGPKTVPDTTTTATAAQPTVSGRVLTPAGAGIRAAQVRLIDANGITTVSTTSSFGVYQFANVVPGQTYTLSVSSKRYRFTPRMQLVTESITNLDFFGLE